MYTDGTIALVEQDQIGEFDHSITVHSHKDKINDKLNLFVEFYHD
jgi:hypothetical protein